MFMEKSTYCCFIFEFSLAFDTSLYLLRIKFIANINSICCCWKAYNLQGETVWAFR